MIYTIAEIGNNHNGNIKKCLKLIDAAAYAGASAVKIQSFRGLDIISPNILSSEYSGWNSKKYKYWYQYIDSIALPLEDHQTIIDRAKKLNLDFITTPVSSEILSILERMKGINYYKIASMDLNNKKLLKALSKTKKQIILSTGMGTMSEVKEANKILKKNNLMILHCVSDYPLEPKNANLNNIKILKETFKRNKIGFSDHSLGHELAVASVALGAQVVEKHFTLSRQDKNPAEHHFSMEPDEFKNMVVWLNHIEKNILKTKWSRSPQEKKVSKKQFRRSFHYKIDYKKGHIIRENDLIFIRPGTGIDYGELSIVLNKKLKKNVNAFDPCKVKDF